MYEASMRCVQILKGGRQAMTSKVIETLAGMFLGVFWHNTTCLVDSPTRSAILRPQRNSFFLPFKTDLLTSS